MFLKELSSAGYCKVLLYDPIYNLWKPFWRCFSSSLVFCNIKRSGASSFYSYSSLSHQPCSPSLIPQGLGFQFSSPFPLTFLLLSARGRSYVSCCLKPLGYVSFFLFIFLFIYLYFGLCFFHLQLPAQWPWIAHWKKAGASPRVCPASSKLCCVYALPSQWSKTLLPFLHTGGIGP